MCEIDELVSVELFRLSHCAAASSQVVDVSKRFLGGMSCRFDDPRLELVIGDGFEYLKKHKNEFDVCITDSSDPGKTLSDEQLCILPTCNTTIIVGPAESLFGATFYELVNEALADGGVLASQGERRRRQNAIRKHSIVFVFRRIDFLASQINSASG